MTIDLQTYQATVGATELAIIDGSVTLDDSWAPYLQGTLTVVTPADSSILDPRELAQLDLVMTQRFGDGLQHTSDLTALYAGLTTAALTTAWAGQLTSALTALIGAWNGAVIPATSLACLGVYITDADPRDDGTTQLTLAGGEHRAQQLRDWSRIPGIASPPGFPINYAPVSIRDLFPVLSPGTLVQGDYDYIVPTAARDALYGQPVLAPEQDQWEPLTAFAQLANLRLWAHPDGIFRLTPREQVVPGTVVLDRAINVSEGISRLDESWADGAFVEYLEDPADPLKPRFQDSTGISSATKVVHIKVNIVTPFDGIYSGNLADQILARMQQRGRTLDVTAVSRFDTAPNMAASIDQPSLGWLPETAGVVDAVTFSIAARTMTVTVRDPEEV